MKKKRTKKMKKKKEQKTKSQKERLLRKIGHWKSLCNTCYEVIDKIIIVDTVESTTIAVSLPSQCTVRFIP